MFLAQGLTMLPSRMPISPPAFAVPLPFQLLRLPAFPEQLPQALRPVLLRALRCPSPHQVRPKDPFRPLRPLSPHRIRNPPVGLWDHLALMFGPFPEQVPLPVLLWGPCSASVPLPRSLLSTPPPWLSKLPRPIFLQVMAACASH